MAKKKKVVEEQNTIYFIDKGVVVEGIVIFETETNYLVSYSEIVNNFWNTSGINYEKLISIDDSFEYYTDCSIELRLRNLEKQKKETYLSISSGDKFDNKTKENKPWYKRIFN